MEILGAFVDGMALALTPENLFYLFIGVLFGNIVGVLPGLGPVTGTVLLIPFTFDLPAATAILMLAGVYYGAMYGGSTTSILLNVPGESASVTTAVEGHRLARAGRAGPALAMRAIAPFVAGTLAVVALMFLAPPLAQVALSFGPPGGVRPAARRVHHPGEPGRRFGPQGPDHGRAGRGARDHRARAHGRPDPAQLRHPADRAGYQLRRCDHRPVRAARSDGGDGAPGPDDFRQDRAQAAQLPAHARRLPPVGAVPAHGRAV